MKYFTVEEANQLLPVITRELEALQQLQLSFVKFYDQLEKLRLSDNPPDDDFSYLKASSILWRWKLRATSIISIHLELN